MERQNPVAGEIYRHFKNKLYQIVGVAIHSENKEQLVIYQALYGNFGMYARPLHMFMSEVDHEKYPDVKQKYRFEKIGRAGFEPDVSVTHNDDASSDQQITKDFEEVNNKDEYNIQNTENKENTVYNENEEYIVNKENSENSEEQPNPDLLAFLDAETYEEKRMLLIAMRPRITDRLINDLAVSIDVTVEEGDLETRFKSLLYCVSKMDEFEVTRLRR